MVRTFPSAPRDRRAIWLLAAVLAVVLAAVSAAVVPAMADDLKDKEKKVGKAIKEAAHDVHVSSKELTRARARLSAAEAKLGTAQAALLATQTRLNAARARDAKLKVALIKATAQLQKSRAELAAAKADVVNKRDEMGALVAANYQQGNPQLIGLAAMLSTGDPKEITAQVNAVHNVMNRQAGMLDDLKDAEDRAEELERQVYRQREAVAAQKAEAAEVVKRQAALEKQAAAERAEVASLVAARASARTTAQRALASDKQILAKLKREEQHIKRLLARRNNKNGNNHQGSANGYLTRPVPGHVTSPFGYRKHPIYGYWGLHDGTDFSTPCGQDMVAVANGTVVSRYWSDVYGNRLVIDLGRVNGKSLAVIYNHASGYRVGSGAHVRRGQVVGDAGSTGWSTGCHLHFTVMLNGKAVDPMPWF